ncbi:MAG: molecular chaperone TorD family protein [Actinobacteria bacterium]|nr:molecular chaperone TorD family protein [Actinomycetota bacterium]
MFDSLIESRSATYGFLARLYRVEIDEDFFNEISSMRFPVNTGNSSVDEGYRLICSYLSKSWPSCAIELAADYTRVFLGHGVNSYSAAYPYESVHTSPKRLMMQEARDEVLALYRAAGLMKNDNWRDGEDHIALELEFEQILCIRTSEALSEQNEDVALGLLTQQYNFLKDHLLNWIPFFTTEMELYAKTDLYKGLAKLTRGFLETDSEFLEDVLDEELQYSA